MSTPIDIPVGKTEFRLPSGDKFHLDLVEASKAVNRISDETKGSQDFAYVDKFRAWLKDHAGVDLAPAQADWLIDHVTVEYAKQKKTVALTLSSLNSSAPLLSSSPIDSD